MAESIITAPERLELPEPFVETDAKVRGEWGHYLLYTAEQVRQAVLAERERCAKVCEAEALQYSDDTGNDVAYNDAIRECVAAIRKG